jgi:uncharacterized protein (UPF0303 family)
VGSWPALEGSGGGARGGGGDRNPGRDYAVAGGAFPLFVEGVGCIGTVAVSGLPQRDDHALVVDVLGEMCGVAMDGMRLD